MGIALQLDEQGHGSFILKEAGDKQGEMDISVSGSTLTVYHTEVLPHAEGKGLSKVLLENMVNYAREHGLKVKLLCPFVHMQFKRHPELYTDIWLKET